MQKDERTCGQTPRRRKAQGNADQERERAPRDGFQSRRGLFTQDDDFLAEATRCQQESLNQFQLSVASIKASRIPGSLIE